MRFILLLIPIIATIGNAIINPGINKDNKRNLESLKFLSYKYKWKDIKCLYIL